jgi:hypothetical protein
VIHFISNTEVATDMTESMSISGNIWQHVWSKMLCIQKKRVTHTRNFTKKYQNRHGLVE